MIFDLFYHKCPKSVIIDDKSMKLLDFIHHKWYYDDEIKGLIWFIRTRIEDKYLVFRH